MFQDTDTGPSAAAGITDIVGNAIGPKPNSSIRRLRLKARILASVVGCAALATGTLVSGLTSSASASTPVTIQSADSAAICLDPAYALNKSKPFCFPGSAFVSRLPAPARSSSPRLAECFSYIGLSIVQGLIEGGPFDADGIGEAAAIADAVSEAADSPAC
jgi:hypothetical protein